MRGESVTELPLDYDAIRKACEDATPGPWTCHDDRPRYVTTAAKIEPDEANWGTPLEDGTAASTYSIVTLADEGAWRYDDIRFIAKSREWVPALLAECEARTKEVEELRESRRALAMENVALAAKLQTLRHAIEFRYEQEERNRGAAS